jgi:hypothetical protein
MEFRSNSIATGDSLLTLKGIKKIVDIEKMETINKICYSLEVNRAAQTEMENYFNLKIAKQLITESEVFYALDYWQSFPIIPLSYPNTVGLSLIGLLDKIEQIIYPKTWLSYAKKSDGPGSRRLSVVPTGASTTQANADVILTGITSQIGMQRFDMIPDYWDVQYITGFDLKHLPYDLMQVIGKLAAIQFLAIAGDNVFPIAGLAGMSLSVDGLSQSIQSTASATYSAYSARIKQYGDEITSSLKRLKMVYDSIKFMPI